MSIVRVHFTRDLMLFVSAREEEVMFNYSELPEDNRPLFVEYVQQEYPSVYAEWVSSMAKRRLTG